MEEIVKSMTQRYALFFAIDDLKRQADYVTTSVDDDGILNALRHFEVI